MDAKQKLQLPQRSMRKLICFECGKYLSACPIKINEHEQAVCARCPVEGFIVNESLTAIMKRLLFPCSNDRYGCKEKDLTWDKVVQHEAKCKHAQDELKLADETFPMDLYEEMKCAKCKREADPLTFLGIDKQILVCKSCESTVKEADTFFKRNNQSFLGNVVRLLPASCKYYSEGCNSMVTWKTVSKHRLYCNNRKVTCPVVGGEACVWNGSLNKMNDHLKTEHQEDEAYLDRLPIAMDISESSSFARLFRTEKALFMMSIRVDTAEKKILADIKAMDSERMVDYEYMLIFYDEPMQRQYVSAKKYVRDNSDLELDEEKAACISMDVVNAKLNDSNLVFCDVELYPGDKDSKNYYIFQRCTWKGCNRFGMKNRMKGHEDTCAFRVRLLSNIAQGVGSPRFSYFPAFGAPSGLINASRHIPHMFSKK